MTTEYMICVDCSGTGVIQGVRCPACNGAGKAITVMSSKPYKKLTSDGSTASYYELPEGATELQHLISYKNMNGQVAEAFRSLYRFGESSHSSRIRDAKKVIFYMQAEIERIKKYEETDNG